MKNQLLLWKINNFGYVTSEPTLLFGVVNQLAVLLVVGGVLGLILSGLAWFLSPTTYHPHKDKVKKYECGFDPFQHGLNSFSVNFFRICVLFLLFDLELVFLFPWCIVLDSLLAINTFSHFWVMAIFLLLLTIAFVFELNLDILSKL